MNSILQKCDLWISVVQIMIITSETLHAQNDDRFLAFVGHIACIDNRLSYLQSNRICFPTGFRKAHAGASVNPSDPHTLDIPNVVSEKWPCVLI